MIMELFNIKWLLYSVIGVLVVALSVLLYHILKRDRKDNKNDDIIHSIKIEDNNQKMDDEPKADIEMMLELMQRDLNDKDIDVVKNFEDEQEAKSIISYQELLRANNKSQINAEPEAVKPVESDEQLKNEVDEIKSSEEPIKRFKNTEFISPIYGRLDSKAEYPTIPNFREKESKHQSKPEIEKQQKTKEYYSKVSLDKMRKPESSYIEEKREKPAVNSNIELEKTLNISPLSEEIKKNDEFLKTLKEFRKKLE